MERIYTRSIDDGHGEQRLIVVNGIFVRLETYAFCGYYTAGSFNPADYEEGKPMPHGFLKKYGFKRHYLSRDEEIFYLQTAN